ncbi:MAG TPA: glycosyltransferase family 1 protein, partial [Akkermansia sp.]|nr:glycosyltransferase family 1 protein [Akkermansia sp.]
MRVLTLGWEFPPLVNGGLGIACLGLSKALAKKVDLRVIVPKADPSVLFDGFQLTGLNNVSYREVEQVDRKYSYDSFALVEHAPIELDPYTTVEGSSGVVKFTKEGRITFSKTHEADLQLFRNKEDLYAGDLALKVIQFSKIAVKVALQQDFDIIHAHDWLT